LSGQRDLQIHEHDPGLYTRREIRPVDRQDVVHPGHDEHNAATDRHGPTAHVRAATPGSDRNAVVMGQLQYGRDLSGVGREHDQVGAMAPSRSAIVRVDVAVLGRGQHVRLANDARQLARELFVGHDQRFQLAGIPARLTEFDISWSVTGTQVPPGFGRGCTDLIA